MKEEFRVPGFRANGIACGIKGNKKKDLALIVSDIPAACAAAFTTNSFKAGPVLHTIPKIQSGKAQAIIANSGNANAANGRKGEKDAAAMAKAAADQLNIKDDLVLVASTGVIGKRLPIEKIVASTGELVAGLDVDGIPKAEEAIMTTDRFPKIEYRKLTVDDSEICMCGIAKGAGMIEPDMATMLAFIMTDAAVDPQCLKTVFYGSLESSFNAITVDGCMSTNDTAILLANGCAGNKILTESAQGTLKFKEALADIMVSLAKAIVKDGEGATKVIEIIVSGARTKHDAKKCAYAIGRSNLVKTAFYGKDPNWGRIISAVGTTGVPFSIDKVELLFDGYPLFKCSAGVGGNETMLAGIMEKEKITVEVKLGMGNSCFRVFASDLSHDYIDINALYHT
ncbi:MAG: bifunctional glutamate N-acetyltransferase/amino-acid acetyltransferase ArgJ [Syntrophales bacterium]|jgi:glutamate N-acetyltransferase/amino-acid N-acetyltransferase|nr:bifunctional glutamate N-acetyltransferase/amino-acid acetyltransferase ArgJ [Syntrophales bacterium]MDY0043797.1 bifunctional glutamate N-acetyltransferase/amino-acid acetyltransferase ArgJ [Syntrophales bacterium]